MIYNIILNYFYQIYNSNNSKIKTNMPNSINSENDNSSYAADENEVEESIENNDNPEYVEKSITSDPLIIKLNELMAISNEIFIKRQSIINLDDKYTLTECRKVLKDIYNDCHLMKKKINIKNDMDRNDKYDIEQQIENIELLNNICLYIYGKYKKKPVHNKKQDK
jgi:hypothetical protein